MSFFLEKYAHRVRTAEELPCVCSTIRMQNKILYAVRIPTRALIIETIVAGVYNNTLFEIWSNDAIKAKAWFEYVKLMLYCYCTHLIFPQTFYFLRRANHQPGGTVYILPRVAANILQFGDVGPTTYQANQMRVHRRLMLKTMDNSPKKDLVLTRAAMPIPFAFVAGRFSIDGIPLPQPDLWHKLKISVDDDDFDVAVPPIAFVDLPQSTETTDAILTPSTPEPTKRAKLSH